MSLNNMGLGFALDMRPFDPHRLLGSAGVMLRMQEGLAKAIDQQRRMFGPALDMHRQIESIVGPTLGALGPSLDVHRQIETVVGSTLGALRPPLDVHRQLESAFRPPLDMHRQIESIAGIGSFGPIVVLTPFTHQLDQVSEIVDRIVGHFFFAERIVRGMQQGLCHRKLVAVEEGDIRAVQRFTVLLGLPPDHWAAVALILWERRWLEAEDPIAYLITAARRAHWNAQRPRRSAFHRRLLREALPDESLGGGLFDPRSEQPYRLVELHRDYGIDDLTTDELILAEARMHGVTRDAAPEELGWTVPKVARVWQALNRRRQRRRDS